MKESWLEGALDDCVLLYRQQEFWGIPAYALQVAGKCEIDSYKEWWSLERAPDYHLGQYDPLLVI